MSLGGGAGPWAGPAGVPAAAAGAEVQSLPQPRQVRVRVPPPDCRRCVRERGGGGQDRRAGGGRAPASGPVSGAGGGGRTGAAAGLPGAGPSPGAPAGRWAAVVRWWGIRGCAGTWSPLPASEGRIGGGFERVPSVFPSRGRCPVASGRARGGDRVSVGCRTGSAGVLREGSDSGAWSGTAGARWRLASGKGAPGRRSFGGACGQLEPSGGGGCEPTAALAFLRFRGRAALS